MKEPPNKVLVKPVRHELLAPTNNKLKKKMTKDGAGSNGGEERTNIRLEQRERMLDS